MTKPEAPPTPAPPDHKIPPGLEADLAPLQPAGLGPADNDPFHRDSIQAQKAFDKAVAAADRGEEEEAVRWFLTAAKLAEAAREWFLAALAFRRVGDFLVDPKPPSDLDRALRMYRRAIEAYRHCGLIDEARELSYYLLRLQMLRGRELQIHWHRRLELRAYWAVAGFGYRPLRVVGMAILLIVLFGVIYWLFGGVVANGTHAPATLGECIYFSGVTFATIGYGDFLPLPAMRPIALIEGFVGALSMGFFVAVLINRLRR